MKKEILERIAYKIARVHTTPEHIEETKAACLDMAQWRIDSVWHKMDEMPKKGWVVIVICHIGAIPFIWDENIKLWEALKRKFGATDWAYSIDLAPSYLTSKEE